MPILEELQIIFCSLSSLFHLIVKYYRRKKKSWLAYSACKRPLEWWREAGEVPEGSRLEEAMTLLV